MAAVQVASARAGHEALFASLIVAALAAASVSFAAVRAGWAQAAGAAAAAFLTGLVAEWAGTRTGVPFGSYRYTGALNPTLGTVPLVVPLAWAGMGLPSYAVGAAVSRGWAGRIAVGAIALTAWDLFLDPQLVRARFWHWVHPGPYHGVPLTNFAGWLLVSAVLMALLDVVLGPGDRLHPGLLASYTVMAVLETVGFAAVFPHGRTVAMTGALGMGIPAAAAWTRRRRVGP